jgi:hypothetical protein
MITLRNEGPQATLISLEAAAVSARSGFGCMFSTSDEYETALIAERRAEGRYDAPRSHWPKVMFAGSVLVLAGAVVLLG